jgi:hypothetical protein
MNNIKLIEYIKILEEYNIPEPVKNESTNLFIQIKKSIPGLNDNHAKLISKFIIHYFNIIYTPYQPKFIINDKYQNYKNSLTFIINELNDFLKIEFAIPIKSKYINIITGKSGYILENDIHIEDGNILEESYKKQIDIKIKIKLNKIFNYIMNIDYRIIYDREYKLKLIL